MSMLVASQPSDGREDVDIARFPRVVTRTFAVNSSDSSVTYEATLIRFANAWQLFLSYSGRVGSWICASVDTPHSDVYSVKMMLGDRMQEHLLVYARSLIKHLCDSLRTRDSLELDRDVVLVLALDALDDKPETFKQIMEGLHNIFKM